MSGFSLGQITSMKSAAQKKDNSLVLKLVRFALTTAKIWATNFMSEVMKEIVYGCACVPS